ncbi:MAG TPA: DUF262 domain-containing protein [Candidatus Atribacteria bacterium]|nr:DUF262 domain-containing protein [Candidatus Atribacteria bacterium]
MFYMGVESFSSDKEKLGGLLMKGNFYEVPPNQRDFEWGKDLIQEFWEDLIKSYDAKDDTYYFGSTIFQYEPNNKVIVYDGQQRLAVATILWAVIRDILYDFKETEIAQIIQNDYICKRTEKKEDIYKLTLNLRNREFFRECIQSPPSGSRKSFDEYEKIHGKLSETNKKIKDCYLFFKETIRKEWEVRKIETDKEKIDFLTDVSTHLKDHFYVVMIKVIDEEEAYLVYESVNQKRAELSIADLFKNYFYRKTGKSNRKLVVDMWNEIAEMLDVEIKHFLKHYWHSTEGVVTERRLFRELKNKVESQKINTLELVRELKEEAKIYSALINPDDEHWVKKDIRELIEEFNILTVKQPLPILVVSRKKFNEESFKEVLKLMVNFSFRYNIICNFPPNVLEKKYSEIAIAIRKGEITDAFDIIEELRKIEKYPDDKIFSEFFIGKTLKKRDNKLARYILKKIELMKRERIDKKTDNTEPLNFDEFTLEHILPRNPNKEWQDYFLKIGIDDEDVEKLKYRIGNLTLLDSIKNDFIKNEFVDKKSKKAYNISLLKINKSLHDLGEWNEKHIEKREKDFFNEAKEIWNLML